MKRENRKNIVITYGTYDLLHKGHTNIFKRARSLGDYLIVGVSTDKFNSLKNKKAFDSFETRFKNVESSKYVDLVIPEDSWDQKITDVKKYDVNIFVMGDDWKGKFNHLEDLGVKVTILKRTANISSTKLREKIKNKQN